MARDIAAETPATTETRARKVADAHRRIGGVRLSGHHATLTVSTAHS
jgi:hypothetical protein